MIQKLPKELFDKGYISEDQFQKIDSITSGNVVSVFYELRSLLYLGVMLFTAGMGILIYENIGDLGHIAAILALCVLTLGCFLYVFKHRVAYTNEQVTSPNPYYDYVALLGCLLFISVQGYILFLYGLLDGNLGPSTLCTAAIFFFVAYRFDHLGVLSLAVTALASFWGISVSLQQWHTGDFFNDDLHIIAIIFSLIIASISLLLDHKGIKKHFTFTYLNFCMLIFFLAATYGLLNENGYFVYALLIYAGCVFTYYMARWKKSFLFLLYAFIAAYIGTTDILFKTIFFEAYVLWFYYSIISCAGFIFFVIKYKNYFSRES
jgi:hypothetical protein